MEDCFSKASRKPQQAPQALKLCDWTVVQVERQRGPGGEPEGNPPKLSCGSPLRGVSGYRQGTQEGRGSPPLRSIERLSAFEPTTITASLKERRKHPLLYESAPQTELPDHQGSIISLHFTLALGRLICLCFYPLAGSPHCAQAHLPSPRRTGLASLRTPQPSAGRRHRDRSSSKLLHQSSSTTSASSDVSATVPCSRAYAMHAGIEHLRSAGWHTWRESWPAVHGSTTSCRAWRATAPSRTDPWPAHTRSCLTSRTTRARRLVAARSGSPELG
ncbi:hypothetical protein V8E36_006192 [Tilletia maclaganii]